MKNTIKHSTNFTFVLSFTILSLICLPHRGQSQNSLSNLSNNDLELFKRQAHQKIRAFEHYIRQIIADADVNSRQAYAKQALRLFKPNATIEIAGKKSGTRTESVYSYLNTIVPSYSKKTKIIVINFIAIQIGEWIQKIDIKGKTYYEAHVAFSQRFCWRKGNTNGDALANFTYCDLTKKETTVILEQKVGVKGNYWQILLGDIEVDSITD